MRRPVDESRQVGAYTADVAQIPACKVDHVRAKVAHHAVRSSAVDPPGVAIVPGLAAVEGKPCLMAAADVAFVHKAL